MSTPELPSPFFGLFLTPKTRSKQPIGQDPPKILNCRDFPENLDNGEKWHAVTFHKRFLSSAVWCDLAEKKVLFLDSSKEGFCRCHIFSFSAKIRSARSKQGVDEAQKRGVSGPPRECVLLTKKCQHSSSEWQPSPTKTGDFRDRFRDRFSKSSKNDLWKLTKKSANSRKSSNLYFSRN